MRKFKPTYIKTKQLLQLLVGEERSALLILHSFLVGKLCQQNIENMLYFSNLQLISDKISEAEIICNDGFKDVSFDINLLSRAFELNLDQKKNGIFYTDKLVVDYVGTSCIYNTIINNSPNSLKDKIFNFGLIISNNIADNFSIKEKFFDFLKTLNKAEINSFRKNIQNLKFLDPTCGDGAFLIHAFEEIFECLKYIDFLQNINEVNPINILEKNIFGNEDRKSVV